MKKTKKISTLQHRKLLLKKYLNIASQNKVRFNYDIVKKIDIESIREKTSFKKILQKHIEASHKNKISYVRRKYNVTKEEANEAVNMYISEGLRYAVTVEREKTEVIRHANIIDLILMLRDNFNDRPDFSININIEQAGIVFEGDPEQFKSFAPILRKEWDNYIDTLYEDELEDSGSPVFAFVFELVYDDLEPFATNVYVSLIDNFESSIS